MFVARNVEADHKDLIHDVAYDFYGRRLATCSSDQSVKVWDLGEDGQWHCTSSWKCHTASVWKVTWAHPEFGQVLATCSFDRSAAIWEELPADSISGGESNSWVRRAFLVDSRTSVTDVKFAPRHLGLLLATCSSDGSLRIYEAPDVMTLSQWSVQHEINCKISLSSITWNPSRIHPPMIAVGSDDSSAGGKVIVFEFSENTRQWIKIEVISLVSDPVHDIAFAPNVGRSYHLLGIASRDVKILSIKPFDGQSTNLAHQSSNTQLNQKFEIKQVAQFNEHGAQVWRVSWNITGTILASSGDDGSVRLWKANYLDNWKCVTELKSHSNQSFHGVSSNQGDRSGTSEGKNTKGHRNFSSLVSPGPMTRH
ncbi:nucleoporin SEH1-A-like [Panonychus citri]|uniref:nucleoporin SEH1-A-like n=1 Tax=Panonychus citri TaxID=50023 RepID=UPI0023072CFA|nr:nucleoporin SEH1-A-like [Panonychus citri]